MFQFFQGPYFGFGVSAKKLFRLTTTSENTLELHIWLIHICPCPTSLSYQGRFSLSCHAKPHEGGWWRARAWQWITLKQDNHVNYSNLEWRKEGRMVFKSLMWLPFGFLNFILESGSYIANRSGKTRAKARKAKKQGLSKSSSLSIFRLLYSWFTDQWGPKSALQQQENWQT